MIVASIVEAVSRRLFSDWLAIPDDGFSDPKLNSDNPKLLTYSIQVTISDERRGGGYGNKWFRRACY